MGRHEDVLADLASLGQDEYVYSRYHKTRTYILKRPPRYSFPDSTVNVHVYAGDPRFRLVAPNL